MNCPEAHGGCRTAVCLGVVEECGCGGVEAEALDAETENPLVRLAATGLEAGDDTVEIGVDVAAFGGEGPENGAVPHHGVGVGDHERAVALGAEPAQRLQALQGGYR